MPILPSPSIPTPHLFFRSLSSLTRLTAEDVRNRFPHINLQFEGRGVFMNLPPHTYTFKAMDEGVEIVCTQVVLGSDTMKAPHGLAFIIGGEQHAGCEGTWPRKAWHNGRERTVAGKAQWAAWHVGGNAQWTAWHIGRQCTLGGKARRGGSTVGTHQHFTAWYSCLECNPAKQTG
ncbi:unnamed protein product, partial [Closterium sp. NIES-54]